MLGILVGICTHTLMLRATLGIMCYNSHFMDKGAEPKKDEKSSIFLSCLNECSRGHNVFQFFSFCYCDKNTEL